MDQSCLNIYINKIRKVSGIYSRFLNNYGGFKEIMQIWSYYEFEIGCIGLFSQLDNFLTNIIIFCLISDDVSVKH